MAENQAPQQNVQTVVVPGEAPPIDKGLVTRSIVYGIVLVNAVASHFGFHFHLNGSEDTIYNYVSEGLLVLSFAQAFWKNNNISKAARIIDEVAGQIDIFAKRNPLPAKPAAPAPIAEAPKADTPAQPIAQPQPAPEAQAPAADQPKQ